MKLQKDDGGPAFPADTHAQSGMSLRDYFAIHAPEPLKEDIEWRMKVEQQANPHNDSYKPRRRSEKEIRASVRYEYADAMIAERAK